MKPSPEEYYSVLVPASLAAAIAPAIVTAGGYRGAEVVLAVEGVMPRVRLSMVAVGGMVVFFFLFFCCCCCCCCFLLALALVKVRVSDGTDDPLGGRSAYPRAAFAAAVVGFMYVVLLAAEVAEAELLVEVLILSLTTLTPEPLLPLPLVLPTLLLARVLRPP